VLYKNTILHKNKTKKWKQEPALQKPAVNETGDAEKAW
jgi:hypothetical protein